MTAKEKALELVDTFKFSCRECDFEENAKQSALKAVDEIIKELESTEFNYGVEKLPFHYWQEVKKEIELL